MTQLGGDHRQWVRMEDRSKATRPAEQDGDRGAPVTQVPGFVTVCRKPSGTAETRSGGLPRVRLTAVPTARERFRFRHVEVGPGARYACDRAHRDEVIGREPRRLGE